jgi:hypothetical protein
MITLSFNQYCLWVVCVIHLQLTSNATITVFVSISVSVLCMTLIKRGVDSTLEAYGSVPNMRVGGRAGTELCVSAVLAALAHAQRQRLLLQPLQLALQEGPSNAHHTHTHTHTYAPPLTMPSLSALQHPE